MSREEAEHRDFASKESEIPEVTANDGLELGVSGERDWGYEAPCVSDSP